MRKNRVLTTSKGEIKRFLKKWLIDKRNLIKKSLEYKHYYKLNK